MSAHEHEQAVMLLATWAVDACLPEEAVLVESHVAGCTSCAAEAASLRETAVMLAALVPPVTPPPALKKAILARVTGPDTGSRAGVRPGADRADEGVSAGPPPLQAYQRMVERLDGVLGGLDVGDWARPAAGDWTVQDLVSHLAAVDEALAGWLREPSAAPPAEGPPADAADAADAAGDAGILARLAAGLDERTRAALNRSRGEPPELTRAYWRGQADDIAGRVIAGGAPLSRRLVPFGGVPLPVEHVLLDRAFETWIHADDIAIAVGAALAPPAPDQMHLMAQTAVGILPAVFAELGRTRPGAAAGVTLTGPGGGEWTVPFGGPGAAHVPAQRVTDVRVDVIEFCLLVGGRREVAALDTQITGDVAAGRDVLVAAASLARP